MNQNQNQYTTDFHHIQQTFNRQQVFFATCATRDSSFRKNALRTLKSALLAGANELHRAMADDLGRTSDMVDFAEIGPVLEEIEVALDHLDEWDAPEHAMIPAILQPSKGEVTREPYGVSLIIGPFNYPIQLTLVPLVGAIASGCTTVIKPSESCVNTSSALAKIINSAFPEEYIHIIEGGRPVNEALLSHPFDFIFFTGSPTVGKVVMKAAAEHLTPVVLELGGKSPLIVLADADLQHTAEQLAFGKFLNAGQTCIAPDYLLVEESVKEPLLDLLTQEVQAKFSAPGAIGKIITGTQVEALSELLEASDGLTLLGGNADLANRYFPPTIVDNVTWNDALMQRELFGPILPVLTFDNSEDVAALVNRHHAKPLAAYVFTRDIETGRTIIDRITCGDAQINGVLTHAVSPYFPFGGVGPSGMGDYHGKFSYEAFTHRKSIRTVA